jgi:hypothetical protein
MYLTGFLQTKMLIRAIFGNFRGNTVGLKDNIELPGFKKEQGFS